MTTATEKAKNDLWARGKLVAAEAVGREFRIKTGPGRFVRGTIAECTVAQMRTRCCSVIAQFRVVLLGPTGVRMGPYFVESLPRS